MPVRSEAARRARAGTLSRVVAAMAGRAFGTLVVAIVLAACGGGSPSPSEAAAFQLRPVVEVVSASSPTAGSVAPAPTCGAEGEQASACLREHANESVIVLDRAGTVTYELGPVVVDGADIAEVKDLHNAAVGWSVVVDLTPEGSNALEATTRKSVGDQIAILVDGRVVSAPTVQAPIGVGTVVVAGGLSQAEAKTLAERLGGG
jgi:preprotein translocase subunit SecD